MALILTNVIQDNIHDPEQYLRDFSRRARRSDILRNANYEYANGNFEALQLEKYLMNNNFITVF